MVPLSCLRHTPREHAVLDALERDRSELVAERNVVASGADIFESEDNERTHRRAVNEPELRLQDGDAGAFRADERACDVEAVLGKELM